MNLLLLRSGEVDPESLRATVEGDRAAHLAGVLRARPGDRLRAGIVRGPIGQARVVQATAERAVVELELGTERPEPPRIELVLALPRPKVLARTLEIAASFAVSRIDLVNAWRVERSYFASPKLSRDALEAALWRGCEQGGTTWLPDIAVHRLLLPFLGASVARWSGRDKLLAHPRAVDRVEGVWPRDTTARTVLAIGPEGGWIDDELASFTKLGFTAVSFGARTLRVEAAVAALLAELDLLDRLRPARCGTPTLG
jgi:RsmE family RNA methyltransferase